MALVVATSAPTAPPLPRPISYAYEIVVEILNGLFQYIKIHPHGRLNFDLLHQEA